jgi:two-component system response regulator PilR (NtrC family)
MDGMTVLEELKRIDPELVILMVTAYASVETAIAAMRKGAFDYVAKPFKHEELLHTLANGLNQRRLQDENRELRSALRDQGRFMEIVGKSPRMLQVFQLVSQAAPSRSTILVTGESGTGKELVAKAIHTNSLRKDKPFVVVNSGSLPHDLLESNLFGHVKGAFTGAVYAKKGLFELADKGTLFFDEIGNVPLETQSKLLRVMQEREFMRLGGVETIRVDVRVVAATNVDLRRAVEEGTFREDLFYRLNVIALPLPPLRQRKEDIPALVQHFTEKYAEENAKVVEGVTPDVLQTLLDYDWPGNVRELENVIERGVVLTTSSVIDKDLVPEHVRSAPSFHMPQVAVPPEGINLREVIARFERRLIESTLEGTGGVQKDAARLLGLKPTTLNEMIKRHAIPLPRDRERRNAARADASPAKTTSA